MLNCRFSALVLFFCLGLSNFCIAKRVTWTESEVSILRSLSLTALPALPNSFSNRFADLAQAQVFGKQLFFDKRLSGNGKLSCASCHQQEKYFTDGLSRAVGTTTGTRNTPTVVGSGWLRWFYWDGRRDSLWSQALIPFEATNEMGSSRLAVTRFVAQNKKYLRYYETVFGDLSIDFLNPKLPEHAGPLGDKNTQDNWYHLPHSFQQQINRVYSNLGKAIAAYERTLIPQANRFDHYVDQLVNLDKNDKSTQTTEELSEDEIAGIKLFINPKKTQCLQCHNGPLLTNGGFHNIGSGNLSGAILDFGRVFGLQSALMDEFNCLGPYSDAKPEQCTTIRFLNRSNHIPLRGAYKTPSLRNVKHTGPYFHDGRFNTLMEVVHYYNKPPVNNGPHEIRALKLQAEQQAQLVAFLNLLTER